MTRQERDGPSVEPPRRKGFGSKMIGCGLKVDLNDAVRLEYQPAGVVCTIEFLEDAAAPD